MPDWLSPAQCFGYLAFALGVACFLQTDDRRFKYYMTAECIAYVVHFLMLGVPTAAASSLVSVARSITSIYSRNGWLALGFVTLNLLLGLGFATTWWTWLPLIASSIGTLALFLLQGVRMRLAMLVGTLLWLVSNILAGSIGGTALELFVAMANLYSIRRLLGGHIKH